MPYLCYARKDRRTKPNDPVITRYVASLFTAVGTDAIVTLEVHNPAAFENAFHCRTVALTTAPLFAGYVKALHDERLCVVSPDPGGVKRTELFREALEATLGRPIGKGFADKHRSAGIVSGDLFVGDVAGATVLILDDLISTGNTLLRAAQAARRVGAKRVIALVTHGLFMAGSAEVIADPAIDRFVVTDAVPAFRLGPGAPHARIDTIPAGPLLDVIETPCTHLISCPSVWPGERKPFFWRARSGFEQVSDGHASFHTVCDRSRHLFRSGPTFWH